jgi:preprotein translocase subunit SecF
MRFFGDAHYTFIEKRKVAYVVSAITIAVGIGAMAFNVLDPNLRNWQRYGVDFTGGTLIQVDIDVEGITTAQVREALGGVSGPEVQRFAEGNDFVIRAPLDNELDVETTRETIEGQLAAAFGEESVTISLTELVGPRIGEELQQKAALAILFSFILTLIYLAIRFEFRFGVAAVIATVHDILITLGFLALFRVEIALPTVAAILTIVGYSLNDTIVVFDRIRENFGKKGARKEEQIDLINRSINETLPRTVLTSLTTLVVLAALFVVGPALIRDFATVLILGILIGTYSSIFVASPALVEIRRRFGEGKGQDRKRRPEPARA